MLVNLKHQAFLLSGAPPNFLYLRLYLYFVVFSLKRIQIGIILILMTSPSIVALRESLFSITVHL